VKRSEHSSLIPRHILTYGEDKNSERHMAKLKGDLAI